jgi:hypothetical protein
MKKTLLIILAIFGAVIILIVVLGIYKFNFTNDDLYVKNGGQINSKDIAYTINDGKVSLKNGLNEKVSTDGSATKTITRYFGNDTEGDLNGDGRKDTAFLLTQDTGGSGLFYYVAVNVNTSDGMKGTNAILLGDRIAPQNTEIRDGIIIVNYADRKLDEPMTTPPSVGASAYFSLNGLVLQTSLPPVKTIPYLISEEETTKYCNGVDMNSEGYQNTITVKKSTTTSDVNPTNLQIIKTVINSATSGMCKEAISQLNIKEDAGVVSIPPIDAWAGVSITMCSCKPQIEVNLLQIPGITKVIWLTQ